MNEKLGKFIELRFSLKEELGKEIILAEKDVRNALDIAEQIGLTEIARLCRVAQEHIRLAAREVAREVDDLL